MGRDPSKLHVFQEADALVVDVYRATSGFPPEERYGLRSQVRRAAVSTATNIVEGCARRTTREYVNFLNIAAGSCAEARYLIDLGGRLALIETELAQELLGRYIELARGLQRLIAALLNAP